MNSRQSSLFVFPDGSYGKEGFDQDKYIKKTSANTFLNEGSKKKNYSLGNELSKLLRGSNNEDKLQKLEKYSSKYASCIRNILNGYRSGKSCFVFCEYVEGSGGILFSLILGLFGFKQYKGTEDLKLPLKPGMRYSIINNK